MAFLLLVGSGGALAAGLTRMVRATREIGSV
jgi:hypothetical protein